MRDLKVIYNKGTLFRQKRRELDRELMGPSQEDAKMDGCIDFFILDVACWIFASACSFKDTGILKFGDTSMCIVGFWIWSL